MLRAVNRYTLEISRTGSPYFERVICFVKPEYAQADRLDLHRAAQQLIGTFDAGVEEQSVCGILDSTDEKESCTKMSAARRLLKLLPLGVAALAGAGITLIVMLL